MYRYQTRESRQLDNEPLIGGDVDFLVHIDLSIRRTWLSCYQRAL